MLNTSERVCTRASHKIFHWDCCVRENWDYWLAAVAKKLPFSRDSFLDKMFKFWCSLQNLPGGFYSPQGCVRHSLQSQTPPTLHGSKYGASLRSLGFSERQEYETMQWPNCCPNAFRDTHWPSSHPFSPCWGRFPLKKARRTDGGRTPHGLPSSRGPHRQGLQRVPQSLPMWQCAHNWVTIFANWAT